MVLWFVCGLLFVGCCIVVYVMSLTTQCDVPICVRILLNHVSLSHSLYTSTLSARPLSQSARRRPRLAAARPIASARPAPCLQAARHSPPAAGCDAASHAHQWPRSSLIRFVLLILRLVRFVRFVVLLLLSLLIPILLIRIIIVINFLSLSSSSGAGANDAESSASLRPGSMARVHVRVRDPAPDDYRFDTAADGTRIASEVHESSSLASSTASSSSLSSGSTAHSASKAAKAPASETAAFEVSLWAIDSAWLQLGGNRHHYLSHNDDDDQQHQSDADSTNAQSRTHSPPQHQSHPQRVYDAMSANTPNMPFVRVQDSRDTLRSAAVEARTAEIEWRRLQRGMRAV